MTPFGWGVLTGLGIAVLAHIVWAAIADARISARQSRIEL